ncbi:fibrobacter succinogenes major paralogous domain-containing protein [bacterium]|nr:fibrobacter succinogenes major paralogous domain-containing protein [bacterium]
MITLFTGCDKKNPMEPVASDPVTDIDGNVYPTVQIGDQIWMAENLKVTRYRNGDAIPEITDGSTWISRTGGARCSYDNSAVNASVYGYLYNWHAAVDPRGIAPEGWHVPGDAEWRELADYLGGSAKAGGKLKEKGTAHWNNPNNYATNETGFTGLPGGYRENNGEYVFLGSVAYFWTTTESNTLLSWYSKLYGTLSMLDHGFMFKYYGFSLRCVKD